MSLGKLASAAAAGVANAVGAATVFKSRFTGTSRQRKGQRLDSEAPRLRSRRLGRWSRRLRIRRLRLRLCHFCPFRWRYTQEEPAAPSRVAARLSYPITGTWRRKARCRGERKMATELYDSQQRSRGLTLPRVIAKSATV